MKKTLVILAAGLLTVGAASAQSADLATADRSTRTGQGRGDMTPEQRADLQTQRLTKQLSLTANQSTQVRTIALAENQEMQALRAKFASADSRQGARQEMTAIREKYDAQLKAVLTADQLTKFNQMRDEQMNKRKEKTQGGGMKKKEKA